MLEAIFTVILVTPFVYAYYKLKERSDKKNYVQESNYEEYENAFFEKLKKENEETKGNNESR